MKQKNRTVTIEPKGSYTTLTGKVLDLSNLNGLERTFVSRLVDLCKHRPSWTSFASAWRHDFQKTRLQRQALIRLVGEDLETRLGVDQGAMAQPGYKDLLAQTIIERFGSFKKFSNVSGLDKAHLSRVFSGQRDLSLRSLQAILDLVGLQIVLLPTTEVTAQATTDVEAAVSRLERIIS